jgi:hypothetical protein
MTGRPLKLQHAGKKGSSDSRYIAVPAHIARMIPEGATFSAELVEEGILYRPIDVPAPKPAPAWVRGAA